MAERQINLIMSAGNIAIDTSRRNKITLMPKAGGKEQDIVDRLDHLGGRQAELTLATVTGLSMTLIMQKGAAPMVAPPMPVGKAIKAANSKTIGMVPLMG
ncbi:hypothetical protein TH63_04955 [Rufibacter radiotolerans]|uniref:Uncharacterized protein n=1 Tax=Rufibacter radiotolerans TaxID=1379910 RepID=A0A0H4VN13_9BACT|nr:hypothetical protein TH63_04955 [Rufibacter radiotolerans]